MIISKEILLTKKNKGFHLITDEIIKALGTLPQVGLLNLFLQHTSAGLCINENADPSVRVDLNNSFDKLIPENEPFYTHTAEGEDDMPAHIKSILTTQQINIPITNSMLNLGVWQGIYLCEFRKRANARKVIATVIS